MIWGGAYRQGGCLNEASYLLCAAVSAQGQDVAHGGNLQRIWPPQTSQVSLRLHSEFHADSHVGQAHAYTCICHQLGGGCKCSNETLCLACRVRQAGRGVLYLDLDHLVREGHLNMLPSDESRPLI